MLLQEKQELNRIGSNSNKGSSAEEEAKKGSKEKEKEKVLDSTNAVLDNTKNKVF